MKRLSSILLVSTLPVLTAAFMYGQNPKMVGLGYQDTPKVRGWHVHDGSRPQPPIVTPSDKPGGAPSDATVLFDGTSFDAWRGRKGEVTWKIVDDAMEVTRGGGDIRTKASFGDCQLHLEWRTPSEVKGKGQGRGNSGVFFCGSFEVQVLDSFGNKTYPDGQAGAMYGQWPPRVNASRGPGVWQSYDIVFEAPRFRDDGSLKSPAYVTVFHNGVCLHHRQAYDGTTSWRRAAKYGKRKGGGVQRGPIRLQDHGNPTRFRNIWVRELGRYDAAATKEAPKK